MRVSEERITKILLPWIAENVKSLLSEGKRIDAIKFVRQYTSWSLGEAKKFVDEQKGQENITVPKYTKQEIMSFLNDTLTSINLEDNLKAIFFDGFDNEEDYEKYGDAFIYPDKK